MSKKTRPPRYDADFQRRAAEQVLAQGCSVTQVARKLRCSPESVKRWCQRHRESIVTAATVPARKFHTDFLPIHVDTPTLSRIEIVTKNGLTLRFPGETSADGLIDIVRRLESSLC